jgi:two-component system, cell cycle sensor histidine kinase and response regulator CckA
MLPTWQRVLGDGIALRLVLCDAPVMAPYDFAELNRIMLVLLDNARDALKGAGEVEVRTTHVVNAIHATGNARPHAVISVSDSGPGVHPSMLPRLFEPFQTTKSGRQGLSLAVADAMVRAAGGLLTYEATPGGRSVFSIYFPQRGQGVDQPGQAMREAAAKMPGGTETILLVEDSLEVRGLIATALRELGYTVLEAAQSSEAMTAQADHGAAIQLLIADVFLPDTTGRRLSREMSASQPTLKTLYISGYEELDLKDDRFVPPGSDFMQKPFTQAVLARVVRRVLDRPGS